jgi:hypothetical protein
VNPISESYALVALAEADELAIVRGTLNSSDFDDKQVYYLKMTLQKFPGVLFEPHPRLESAGLFPVYTSDD